MVRKAKRAKRLTLESMGGSVLANCKEYKRPKKQPHRVYFLVYRSEVVYVGQTKDLHARVQSHKKNKRFTRVYYIDVDKTDALLLESALIKLLAPMENSYRPIDGTLTELDQAVIRKYGVNEVAQ